MVVFLPVRRNEIKINAVVTCGYQEVPMNSEQLRIFLNVADYGSFSKAEENGFIISARRPRP
jgi:hypothetical protein